MRLYIIDESEADNFKELTDQNYSELLTGNLTDPNLATRFFQGKLSQHRAKNKQGNLLLLPKLFVITRSEGIDLNTQERKVFFVVLKHFDDIAIYFAGRLDDHNNRTWHAITEEKFNTYAKKLGLYGCSNDIVRQYFPTAPAVMQTPAPTPAPSKHSTPVSRAPSMAQTTISFSSISRTGHVANSASAGVSTAASAVSSTGASAESSIDASAVNSTGASAESSIDASAVNSTGASAESSIDTSAVSSTGVSTVGVTETEVPVSQPAVVAIADGAQGDNVPSNQLKRTDTIVLAIDTTVLVTTSTTPAVAAAPGRTTAPAAAIMPAPALETATPKSAATLPTLSSAATLPPAPSAATSVNSSEPATPLLKFNEPTTKPLRLSSHRNIVVGRTMSDAILVQEVVDNRQDERAPLLNQNRRAKADKNSNVKDVSTQKESSCCLLL